MALSVVLSFLLALYLRFSKSPVSRALGKLYLLPRFIPGIAAVYAVMNVIKDSGSINRIAAAFGVDYKPGLLSDLKGIILSNLWFCIPFAAMMMSAALSSVNDSYVESARDAGSVSYTHLDVYKRQALYKLNKLQPFLGVRSSKRNGVFPVFEKDVYKRQALVRSGERTPTAELKPLR